jgi:release factor glutamine methyltransferase
MKLKEVLDRTVQFFKDKHLETPRLDTEILLAEAMGFKSRVDIYLKFDQPLKEEELSRSRDFVRRRAAGEPVAYITGKKEFFKINFFVSAAVLIPRPETELLVEEALLWAQKQENQNLRILDLGCGSGCIGLSLLKNLSQAYLVAVDKSAEAVAVAQRNAENLGLSEKVQFISKDVLSLDFATESFDLVIANPPYISKDDPDVEFGVKAFEPEIALFSGKSGLQDLQDWSSKAVKWLKPKAWMGFEMGATQGEAMRQHFVKLQGLENIRIIKDLAGLDRHIVGEKNG